LFGWLAVMCWFAEWSAGSYVSELIWCVGLLLWFVSMSLGTGWFTYWYMSF